MNYVYVVADRSNFYSKYNAYYKILYNTLVFLNCILLKCDIINQKFFIKIWSFFLYAFFLLQYKFYCFFLKGPQSVLTFLDYNMVYNFIYIYDIIIFFIVFYIILNYIFIYCFLILYLICYYRWFYWFLFY
jgi:hypothetical protein